MNHRSSLLITFLFAVPAVGCFQELDPTAASGGPLTDGPQQSTFLTYAEGGVCPDGKITGGSDGVGGFGVCIPKDTTTPPIKLVSDDSDAETTSPCDAIEAASMAIRTTNCGPCHAKDAANGVMGGFDFILDDAKLQSQPASNMGHYIVAGDPTNSFIYQRIQAGLVENQTRLGMPPVGVAPRPTFSDLSVIRSWIMCLANPAAGGSGDMGLATIMEAGAGSAPSTATQGAGDGGGATPSAGGDSGAAPQGTGAGSGDAGAPVRDAGGG